eukprot:SAG31_NODE_909_length_11079_cov_176.706102_6_plen_155_part_00
MSVSSVAIEPLRFGPTLRFHSLQDFGGSEAHTQRALGCAPLLIQLLGDGGGDAAPIALKTQCAWTLGNLAADSAVCRMSLRQGGAVPPLVAALQAASGGGAEELELVKTAAWGLSNLARGASAEDEAGLFVCRAAMRPPVFLPPPDLCWPRLHV